MNDHELAELYGAERVGRVGPTANREHAEWSVGLLSLARDNKPSQHWRLCLLSVERTKQMFENRSSRRSDENREHCKGEYSTGIMEWKFTKYAKFIL